MTDIETQYILRQPITISADIDLSLIDIVNLSSKAEILGWFKPLDIEQLRQQITEILNDGFGDSTHFIESNNLCVGRILEVTLGRKQ
jgi:hypothetical protein